MHSNKNFLRAGNLSPVECVKHKNSKNGKRPIVYPKFPCPGNKLFPNRNNIFTTEVSSNIPQKQLLMENLVDINVKISYKLMLSAFIKVYSSNIS